MRIYFDTNIYKDYFENRNDGIRPLGEFAFSCFQRAINCEYHIIFSEHVGNELKATGVPKEKINGILTWLGRKILRAEIKLEDKNKARKISKKYNLHFADALHYVIALREADKLLTNDNDLKKKTGSFGYESFNS